jgi:hypothetical protein
MEVVRATLIDRNLMAPSATRSSLARMSASGVTTSAAFESIPAFYGLFRSLLVKPDLAQPSAFTFLAVGFIMGVH